MKILLLGGGGREHALAWKIAQSEKCEKLFIAPGNAGTQNVGENVDIKADDFEALKNFAVENAVDMVIVGPEDPLVKGVYDDFKNDPRTHNIPVIGPSKAGAVLEGSKDFAKQFMKRHNIPTAQYETFDGEHMFALETPTSSTNILRASGVYPLLLRAAIVTRRGSSHPSTIPSSTSFLMYLLPVTTFVRYIFANSI